MIHILNNLPKDYNMILDGLENRLTATGDNMLTIDLIKTKKKKKLKKKGLRSL